MLEHKHFISTVLLAEPPTSPEELDGWLTTLVSKVGMIVLSGPFSTRCDEPGNEGVTGVICLTTSHSSIHVWDTLDQPFMKFDLYSCKDFDVQVVIDHMACWKPVGGEYIVLDRTGQLDIVERGVIQAVAIQPA